MEMKSDIHKKVIMAIQAMKKESFTNRDLYKKYLQIAGNQAVYNFRYWCVATNRIVEHGYLMKDTSRSKGVRLRYLKGPAAFDISDDIINERIKTIVNKIFVELDEILKLQKTMLLDERTKNDGI